MEYVTTNVEIDVEVKKKAKSIAAGLGFPFYEYLTDALREKNESEEKKLKESRV